MRGSSILPAIEEAIALGFIERADTGRKAWGPFKGSPALYGISWLPNWQGSAEPNLWKRFATVDQARDAADRAKLQVVRGRLEAARTTAQDEGFHVEAA